LVLIAIGMLFTPLSMVSLLPFQFNQSIHRRIALPAIVGVVRLGTAYAALWLLNQPVGFQAAGLTAGVVAALLNAWWARRVYPESLKVDFDLARQLLRLGWPAAALEFIVAIYSRASYFFLHDAGPVVQGEYAAADRLMKPLMAIAGAMVASSLPTLAGMAARRDFALLRETYGRSVLRVSLFCAALCGVAWFFAAWLLNRFAPEYRQAIWPFRVLSVGTVFLFLNMLSTIYILALGRFRTIMNVAACNLIVYLVLAKVLIPHYGAIGAALSTSVMEAVNTVIQLWIVSRLLKQASTTAAGA
jgi:O-antigen/teichoic acid export membrane protein